MSLDDINIKDGKILLVDDTPANLEVLCGLLQDEGYKIYMASSGPQALKIVERAEPDLILLDVMMPNMDGYEVCKRLKANKKTRAIPIIFITAKDLKEDIITGFRVGGVDYITKPFQDQEVLVRAETHLRLSRMREELLKKNQALEEEMTRRRELKSQLSLISEQETARWGLEGFVGQSPTIERIFNEIRLMQENLVPSVLIAGESGTGKELIARAIHFGGGRKDGPFVPVNCAAMPSELAESLLFGHLKGSFTGADQDRIGYFQMAHEGTLFLDELGEMPLELQAKLLRVLEDGQVQRIGDRESRKVDVRILAATNVALETKISDGSFRQDLYFRLARFTVTAPPLRERQDDIPLLAQHFLALFAAEMGREAPELGDAALAALTDYDFPGNVRELKNIIERALIECGGQPIAPQHLHFMGGNMSAANGATDIPFDLDKAELWLIKRALAECDGNVSMAARLLNTNRNRIYRALSQEKESV